MAKQVFVAATKDIAVMTAPARVGPRSMPKSCICLQGPRNSALLTARPSFSRFTAMSLPKVMLKPLEIPFPAPARHAMATVAPMESEARVPRSPHATLRTSNDGARLNLRPSLFMRTPLTGENEKSNRYAMVTAKPLFAMLPPKLEILRTMRKSLACRSTQSDRQARPAVAKSAQFRLAQRIMPAMEVCWSAPPTQEPQT
mmetsp:Transcript_11484/g.23790  ORF Transcript_11484/g.23790 Transcript_11484/m.23790 type:complete len:200 (-) Transcript_11484:691-1290(-)